uniref:Putative secreted protein n=1 Tax=Anopheles darlingi TaxID=43151 RepID=A0A2M4D1M7_ANODA
MWPQVSVLCICHVLHSSRTTQHITIQREVRTKIKISSSLHTKHRQDQAFPLYLHSTSTFSSSSSVNRSIDLVNTS